MAIAWLKKLSVEWVRHAAVVAAIGLSAATSGCNSGETAKLGIAKGCTLNSECNGGLVCSFGVCHSPCNTTKDCPSGQRCVKLDSDGGSTNICQLPDRQGEGQCHLNSDCDNPLVCAVDLQCRTQCEADRDCLSDQICVKGGGTDGKGNVCADKNEVTSTGHLVGAASTDAGGNSSTPDSGTGPHTDKDSGPTCQSGVACTPAAGECHTGASACSGNTQSCTDTGNQANGTPCTGGVCTDGTCTPCVENDPCIPDPTAPCSPGTLSCSGGKQCNPGGDPASLDGKQCAAGSVCSSGTCTPCTDGVACTPTYPGSPCHNGKISCAQGGKCVDEGTNATAGTSCGTDQVCDGSGLCTSCTSGDACSATGKECVIGKIDCTKGPTYCDVSAPTNATDGTTCTGDGSSYYNFCAAGVCAPCGQGNACVPTNPCHLGYQYCGSPPSCSDQDPNNNNPSYDQPDGTSCSTDGSKSCLGGQCLANGRVLTVTAGDKQSAAADNTLATSVTVHVVDSGGAAVAGAKVTVTADPGAYAAPATTDASGNAKLTVRVGRALKTYNFTATTVLAATNATFTATATAPAAKNIFTLVDIAHTGSSNPVTPGPGTMLQPYNGVGGMAVAKDGTIYFADYSTIYKLDTDGNVTLVAGSGDSTTGPAVNGVNATAARFYNVTGLALDETNNLLYISDYYNYTVRVLDFASGTVTNYAGSSTASNAAPYGDGGNATDAYIGNPSTISVAPNGDLYISDSGRGIRKVDASTGTITTWMPVKSCGSNDIFIASCDYSAGQGCSVAWDSKGQPFVSAYYCTGSNTTIQGNTIYGVMRVDGNGNVVQHIGGWTNGSGNPGEGVVATSAYFASIPQLAFDAAGDLYLSIYDQHLVRRIDAMTYKITTVAGDNVDTIGSNSGFAGDYQLASTSSKLNYPGAIGFDSANHLYIADQSNIALRAVWAQGDTVVPTGTMTVSGGTGQTVYVDNTFLPLKVTLKDASSAAITGVPVKWQRGSPGSGFTTSDPTQANVVTGAIGATAGVASITGRVGLAVGNYTFTASYGDIHGTPVTGSPASFTVAAKAADPGMIFTIADALHINGSDNNIPGPATFSKFSGRTYAVAGASDGSMYFAAGCSVFYMSKQGEISRFVGDGTCGFKGDGGQASKASIYYPEGLALDETNKVLYIADTQNGVVREVDLTTGTIFPFAGLYQNPNNTSSPYGDGGPATSANLYGPRNVSFVNDSGGNTTVYFVDASRSRIWDVDPAQTIHTFMQPGSCATTGVNLTSLSYYSQVFWNADGTAYITGTFCGNATVASGGTVGNNVIGVALRATNGTLKLVAGAYNNVTTEGSPPLATTFTDIAGLAVDSSGKVYVTPYTEHKIFRFTPGSTAAVELIAGTPGAPTSGGYAGDYVTASTSSVINDPYGLAMVGGHLVFADEYNYCYRMVW